MTNAALRKLNTKILLDKKGQIKITHQNFYLTNGLIRDAFKKKKQKYETLSHSRLTPSLPRHFGT